MEEAILQVCKVMVMPSEQLHLEKVLTTSGSKYQPAHVATRHFILAVGASMADVDVLLIKNKYLPNSSSA